MGFLRNWLDRFLFKRGYRKHIPPVPTTFYQHAFKCVDGDLFRCEECGQEIRHNSTRDYVVFPSLCDPHPRYPRGSVVRLTDTIEVRCADDPTTFIFVKPGEWRDAAVMENW